MALGGARPGAGRKPGSSTRMNEEARKAALAGGISPLEYLLGLMRDDDKPEPVRLDAAKAAAPYIHSKLATVEMNANVSVSHEETLKDLA